MQSWSTDHSRERRIKGCWKRVPPTSVIPNSDNEEEEEEIDEDEEGEETECVDLTEGGDEIHDQAIAMPESTTLKAQEESKEEPKKSEAAADQTIVVEDTGQAAQPVTSEDIFLGCESF